MAKLAILSSLVVTLSMIIPATATAQSAESVPEPVIPAQVDRRDVHIPKISASDIEVGAYTGILSVQDFGAKSSSGLRLGYHVTEDFFVEGMYGRSTVSDQAFRRLGIAIFNREGGVGNVNFNGEGHTAYNFGIGIRALPVDWFSMRFEIRDHMFNSDLLGKNELKHNFEMTLGLAAYF